MARRILKWSSILLATLLILVMLGLAFLHSGPGQELLRSKVEEALGERYDGVVTLGSLDFALFGDVGLGDLRIAQRDGGDVLTLKKVALALDWGALVGGEGLVIERLGVDGLDLDLIKYADGTTNLQRMQREPLKLPEGGKLTLRELDITHINVTITEPDGGVTRLAELTVHGAIESDGPAKTADVSLDTLSAVITIDKPGQLKATLPLSVGLSLSQRGENLHLKTEAIDTKAHIERPGQEALDLPIEIGALTLDKAAGLLTLKLAETALGPLKIAAIEADARLSVWGKPAGEQRLSLRGLEISKDAVNALLGRALLLTDLRADLSVEGPPEGLALSGDVKTAGGVFALRGTADVSNPLSPAYDLKFTGKEIDSHKLIAGEGPAVQTGVTITAKGKGIDPGSADADVTFTMDPSIIAGRPIDGISLVAGAHGGVYKLDHLAVSAFGQTLTLDGQLDPTTGEVVATLKSTTTLADAVAKAREAGVLLVPLPPLAGELDVDLVLKATLKPVGAELNTQLEEPGPLAILDLLPVKAASLVGHLRGRDVKAGPQSLGALDVGVDMKIAGRKPSGTLTLALRDADLGDTSLEKVDLSLLVDGLSQTFQLTVRDSAQQLAVDLGARAVVDLDARAVQATVNTLAIKRGAFTTALRHPITLDLVQPSANGEVQRFTLPRTSLSLAGGVVNLEGAARLVRDPAHPEAQRLASLRALVELEGLSLRRLAALGRRGTRGASGTLSGRLSFDGTPDDPELGFSMKIKARAGRRTAPVSLEVAGVVHDKRLSAKASVSDAKTRARLVQLDLKAPLSLGAGRPPGLAPGGRLSLALDLPRRSLGALAAYGPAGLPLGLDPGATVAAHAELVGTPARPTGELSFEVEGALAKSDKVALPARQRLSVAGTLAQRAGETLLDFGARVWLDADRQPLARVDLHGIFDRSPLLRTGLRRPWKISATLGEIDLADLPAPEPLRGKIASHLALAGDARDLTGDVSLSALGVKAGAAPVADLELALKLTERALGVDIAATVGGLEALTLGGTIGLAGEGLRRRLRRPAELRRAPLDLTLTIPKRALAEWRAAAPKLPSLPGDIGGALHIGGTLAKPVAEGGLAYDGFTTLAGAPGRVGLAVDAGAETVKAALQLGPLAGEVAPVSLALALDRAQLADPRGPLDIGLSAQAEAVDLLSLVPGYALGDGEALDIAGVLDWAMDGALRLAPRAGGGRALDAAASRLDGQLVIRDGRLKLPGTERIIEPFGLRLGATPEVITLGVGAHEADLQRSDRSINLDAEVALDQLTPASATLSVKVAKWLVLGLGLDSPEGELDMDMAVTATKLGEPVRDVDVLIRSLHLNSPERFVRAHQPQFLSYFGDVIYLDESGLPSGKLVPKVAPSEPKAASTEPAATEEGAPAPGGFDVHLRIPDPIRITKEPLDIWLKGGMEVAARGEDLQLDGDIEMTEGTIGVMGRYWKARRGTISAHGGLESFATELVFAEPLHATALRDIALDSGGDKSVITIRVTPDEGQVITFGGASGPYLLDAASELNQGKARIYTRADTPASGGVQFGGPLQALVNSFVQTNMRNLMFMDRTNGWSEYLDDPAQYGRIWSFIGERYVDGDARRVRLFAQPPTRIGQNHIELQYDWLFSAAQRSVAGVGARLGTDLRLGLGLFWEFYSEN